MTIKIFQKISVHFIILYLGAIILASQSFAGKLDETGNATVKSDKLAVYSRMSVDSKILAELKNGEQVRIVMEMLGSGSDGPWCNITTEGDEALAGYVQCVHLERQAIQQQEWLRIGSSESDSSNHETKAIISRNRVFVPATIEYDHNDHEILFLLDTGASISSIHTDIAEKLDIDLRKSKNISVRVVGGSIIKANLVKLKKVTVGPHEKKGMEIAVVEQKGPRIKYDGLLGMDFLKNYQYQIDFKNKTINWDSL